MVASPQTEVEAHYNDIKLARTQLDAPSVLCTPLPENFDKSSLPANVKIAHFVRHGVGIHNKLAEATGCLCKTAEPCPYTGDDVFDASLIDIGIEQATTLSEKTKTLSLDCVFVSPLRRTIQTALHAFPAAPKPFIAVESLREQMGIHICDKRRNVSSQSQDFPHAQIDYSLISEEDESWTGNDTRETRVQVAKRAREFMNFLRTRPEKEFAVVTHSSWLLTCFNLGMNTSDPKLQKWFETAEMRSVLLTF